MYWVVNESVVEIRRGVWKVIGCALVSIEGHSHSLSLLGEQATKDKYRIRRRVD